MSLSRPFFVRYVDPRKNVIVHDLPVPRSSLDDSAPVAKEAERKDGIAIGVCDCCKEERLVCITYMTATEKWCGCGRWYYKRAWEAE